MKINGYELQPHEIKLFDMASRNSTSVRVVGFLIDIVIFALMLVTVFTIGGYGVWLFNFIYGFQLFVSHLSWQTIQSLQSYFLSLG